MLQAQAARTEVCKSKAASFIRVSLRPNMHVRDIGAKAIKWWLLKVQKSSSNNVRGLHIQQSCEIESSSSKPDRLILSVCKWTHGSDVHTQDHLATTTLPAQQQQRLTHGACR